MRLCCVLLALAATPSTAAPQPATIEVSRQGPITTIGAAIARARPGDTLVIHAGVYRERVTIDRAITMRGIDWPIIDGEGGGTVVHIAADRVTLTGVVVRNTGFAYTSDLAGIHLDRVRDCQILGNRVEHTQLGIHADSTRLCTIAGNRLDGRLASQSIGGNGIHAWSAESLVVRDNDVRHHRDGIYFEFVHDAVVSKNRVEASQRYGLHFMFSHDCAYDDNAFVANRNGIAVMYSQRVSMQRNRFERSLGGSAYGLLLKEISDSHIAHNTFDGNSSALMLDAANRNVVSRNVFRRNGWGVRLLASASDNEFVGNTFVGNAFDVSTNSRTPRAVFRDNFWDRYAGYDLDRDGRGDVRHHPVTLFAAVVERVPPTVILLRSLLVELLSVAERVVPVLTPDVLFDASPRMRP